MKGTEEEEETEEEDEREDEEEQNNEAGEPRLHDASAPSELAASARAEMQSSALFSIFPQLPCSFHASSFLHHRPIHQCRFAPPPYTSFT